MEVLPFTSKEVEEEVSTVLRDVEKYWIIIIYGKISNLVVPNLIG